MTEGTQPPANDVAFRWIIRATILVVVISFVARSVSLARPLSAPSIDPGSRISALQHPGQGFCFDPQTPILLAPGTDGMPGVRDHDDNVNGVVDDQRELGAVGSDDVCLGPSDAGYDQIAASERAVAISRGAYLVCDGDSKATIARWKHPSLGWLFASKE